MKTGSQLLAVMEHSVSISTTALVFLKENMDSTSISMCKEFYSRFIKS